MSQSKNEKNFPPQKQDRQPGIESKMRPEPEYERPDAWSAKRLENKVAVISGGDSGIGRAVSIAFAKEGAHIAILYKDEHADAEFTKNRVEKLGRKCITLSGDVSDEDVCRKLIENVMSTFDRIDILVNNAAEQHVRQDLSEISATQLDKTFKTNIYGYFFLTKAALPFLKKDASIVNTASVTAYRGSDHLIDYSATKGAIVTFTRSLAKSLIEKGIRVNAVAPGPVWTPLIPASFSEEEVEKFGSHTAMKRAGQPAEIAPSYVFLASEDASFMSGQVLHPNGGEMVGS